VSRRITLRVVALVLVGSSCGSAPQADAIGFVDLSQRDAVPSVADVEVAPLRIAVAAIISPEGTVDSYRDLADYLGNRLDRPVALVQRRTYAEVNDLVARDEVDLAFVCTSAYVAGRADFGMELLVVPEIGGERVYHSQVIVPAGSNVTRVADLRGQVFAFTDPISTTGTVYPTYLVQQMGETTGTFFGRTFFTYGHDRAIQAVAEGIADGAAVDSVVLDHAFRRDPALLDLVKVIHESAAFGMPPVVVSPQLSPRREAELRALLLGMSVDPAGKEILTELGIDQFAPANDGAYDGVRSLIGAVEGGP
jgi:phosphonate transport system substrate-binding protein